MKNKHQHIMLDCLNQFNENEVILTPKVMRLRKFKIKDKRRTIQRKQARLSKKMIQEF